MWTKLADKTSTNNYYFNPVRQNTQSIKTEVYSEILYKLVMAGQIVVRDLSFKPYRWVLYTLYH